MKILVLYEELAPYFINCVNEFADKYNCRIFILCKGVNAVAPFQFDNIHSNIEIKNRDEFNEQEIFNVVRSFSPDAVFVGGWLHKPYIKLIKKLKLKNTIIGFDNQWTGSLKQRLGIVYFKVFIKPYIRFAFVPGKKQHLFAKKLGFDESEISEGIYCCEYNLFCNYYDKHKKEKEMNFPKRFLYVGRYAKEKAVEDLWNTFIEWQNEQPNEWELWCLGKGDIEPVTHSKIKHFGFLQSHEMDSIIKDTGVFILPSTFEPWGVVIHEYSTAGFPLLSADKVGAAGLFIEQGLNGFLFETGNNKQLKEKMNKFSTLNQKELNDMALYSTKMAAKITPVLWAERLMKMCKHE
ncbi:MAG TPA: glycosyltransferase [Bacteroidia bacterium]|jgi:glycosyltransferase involved in cell wall biosynthesis|nr:glycosyltransferase [Bacteroidia bacterium]